MTTMGLLARAEVAEEVGGAAGAEGDAVDVVEGGGEVSRNVSNSKLVACINSVKSFTARLKPILWIVCR